MSKLSTTTEPGGLGGLGIYPPIHPGEMLREEFLEPLGMTPYALAKKLRVPRTRIERLVREETALSTDTALRLARYFGNTPQFWLNMQRAYELTLAEMELRTELEQITPLPPEARDAA